MYAAETLIDEKALVLRLIDGDEDAFCELYAAYKGRLIYFAMRFLKSREHAEDVFQDAFTVIWQSRRFINPDASFSSYLYTIVRNRVLNQLRDLDNQNKLKEHVLAQAVDYTDETKNEILAYIIHSGFISGYQNRYGDNLKPPTNVYHRMTA